MLKNPGGVANYVDLKNVNQTRWEVSEGIQQKPLSSEIYSAIMISY